MLRNAAVPRYAARSHQSQLTELRSTARGFSFDQRSPSSSPSAIMEDPHLPSGPEGSPILYYSGGSLPCQMARLALEEKGVEYRLRHVNLNSLEQARA
jgi:hypothetical protein